MRLYTETRVRADFDELWARTQDPAEHQRWDLRFTEIRCLPRTGGESRHFRYAPRVLPFLTIAGTGVSAGEEARPDGTRTSALRFSCPHPLSPLADGSGYWLLPPGRDRHRRALPHRVRLPAPLGCRGSARGPAGAAAPDGLGDGLVLRPAPDPAGARGHPRTLPPQPADGSDAPGGGDRRRHRPRPGAGRPARLRGSLPVPAAPHGGDHRRAAPPAAGTVLALEPVALPGSAGAFLSPLLLMAAITAALRLPPPARTPAARRCLRTPPAPVRPPRLLRTLETPR
ncbi:hypothetical protein [Streptomyces sp. KMM 9044]|uniref:hypothetical protein n=1 Tax=Streptomyces sp. KMM 9044 TaxID=2744474 RepID=UPI002151ACD3